jgi:hypothetical protein
MKNTEVLESFCNIEDSMRLAINGVEKARDEARSNLTRIYWMVVKMQNNHRKFTDDEIERASVMESQLEDLVDHYNDMIDLENTILKEFSNVKQKISEVDNIGLDYLQGEMDVDGLYEKMNTCLTEGQICMSRQKKLLADANALERSLEDRGGAGGKPGLKRWWQDLMRKVKGVYM